MSNFNARELLAAPGTIGERIQRRIDSRPATQRSTYPVVHKTSEPVIDTELDLTVESSSEGWVKVPGTTPPQSNKKKYRHRPEFYLHWRHLRPFCQKQRC